MPFFSGNAWLNEVSTFWLWVVLTVPSTGLAFLFYLYWKRRGERLPKREAGSEGGIEIGEVGGRS
jgi:hypothetical protein